MDFRKSQIFQALKQTKPTIWLQTSKFSHFFPKARLTLKHLKKKLNYLIAVWLNRPDNRFVSKKNAQSGDVT
jgi:hypothetical protein